MRERGGGGELESFFKVGGARLKMRERKTTTAKDTKDQKNSPPTLKTLQKKTLLQHPLRGLHLRGYPRQVPDGRHAPARVPFDARFSSLQRHDGRRGPRAHAAHRRAVRARQGRRALPARPQTFNFFGDARRGEVQRVLRRRADLPDPRPALPGRHPVHEGARGGLRACGGGDGAADPRVPAATGRRRK